MRRRAPTSIPPAQLSLFDRLGLVPRPVPPPPPPPPPALSPPPAPPTPRPVEPDLRHVHLNGHPVAWELRRARRRTIGLLIDERGLRVDIEVDGGITEHTAPAVVAAGANVLVAGAAVFGHADRKGRIDAIRRAAS